MRPRARRLPLLLALVLLIALVPVAPARQTAARPAVTQADGSTRLATVKAGFDLLMDQFYRVPDPALLLDAGWTGALRTLNRAGLQATPPDRPDFPPDRDGAWQAFAGAYPALAALAPARLAQVDIAFGALQEMASSLHEGHTSFLPPATYRRFVEDLGGDTIETGLGIRVSSQRPWTITDVYFDAPGDRAGLRPGDIILAVDGRAAADLPRADLDDSVAGRSGGDVTLTVQRTGAQQLDITITPGEYAVPDLTARVLSDGTGVIRLREFSAFVLTPSGNPNVVQLLDEALERFEQQGAVRWVIDLRDNPGGYTYTAAELLARFLPDAITAQIATERGDSARERVAGRMFRAQRPMAVLVNRGSASSSEIFSGTLKEYGRAVIVGTRTSGTLAGAIPYPLPDGAGLYIAVEEVRTGRTGTLVDGVGITPDVTVADDRTGADLLGGRDAQLAAAIKALMGRPDLPSPKQPAPALSVGALRSLASPYFPDPADVPVTSLIPSEQWLGDLALTEPSEWVLIAGANADPEGLIQTVRDRGWLGSYDRFYGEIAGLGGPYIAVSVDVYASERGAIAALNSNDAPQVQREAPVPVQLGDGAVAYTGAWEGAGSAILAWRSGRIVVTVGYSAAPGQESFDPVVTVARLVDARLQATPVPATTPAVP